MQPLLGDGELGRRAPVRIHLDDDLPPPQARQEHQRQQHGVDDRRPRTRRENRRDAADELRALGLPTAPNFCTWGEDLSATFQLGQKV